MKLHQVKSEPQNIDILFFRVSISIKLAAFQASGGAYMKLQEIGVNVINFTSKLYKLPVLILLRFQWSFFLD